MLMKVRKKRWWNKNKKHRSINEEINYKVIIELSKTGRLKKSMKNTDWSNLKFLKVIVRSFTEDILLTKGWALGDQYNNYCFDFSKKKKRKKNHKY